MAMGEPPRDAGERGRDVAVVHSQDAFDHRWGAGVAAVHLLAWDKNHRDGPAGVGTKPERAPGDDIFDQLRSGQWRDRARRRPCCSVEISANVDSAPWLRFGPSARSPS